MSHIQDGECCLAVLLETFGPIYSTCGFSGDVTDIYNYPYQAINDEGEKEDGWRIMFKHQHRDLEIEHSLSSLPITALERNFEQFQNWNLHEVDPNCRHNAVKCRIYRQSPIDWSKLEYLNLRTPIRPGNVKMIYDEHNDLTQLSLDNLLEGNYYNSVLDKNIKFAFFSKIMEHQAEIIGHYTGPITNSLVPKFENFDQTWMTNWTWIEQLNCSAEEFVVSLNQQSYSQFKNVLKFFQKCLHSTHYKKRG